AQHAIERDALRQVRAHRREPACFLTGDRRRRHDRGDRRAPLCALFLLPRLLGEGGELELRLREACLLRVRLAMRDEERGAERNHDDDAERGADDDRGIFLAEALPLLHIAWEEIDRTHQSSIPSPIATANEPA